MSKRIILLSIFLFVIFFIQSKIKSVDDKITIVAWTGVAPSETSLARFQELRSAGFNCNLTYYPNIDSLSKAMQIANQVGIKMLLLCPQLFENSSRPKEIAEKFANNPATLGYFLRDEPLVKDFAYLADLSKHIESGDSKHFCYVNLNPMFASPQVLGAASYSDYLDKFIKIFNPKVLSFDHYPVMPDRKGKLILRKNWYENLEIISRKAKEAKIPFWGFALATAHAFYPIPTVAQLKVQVFSNLAYGAQGIQYFNYWTQSGRDTNPNTMFRNGPIDNVTKTRTNVYYFVKEVNQEIKNLMKVFYNSEVISVNHIGLEIPRGTNELKILPSIFKKLDSHGANIILSQLKNGTDLYFIIVNKDFENEISITVQFATSSIKKIHNNGHATSVTKKKKIEKIPPGDVLIYRIKVK